MVNKILNRVHQKAAVKIQFECGNTSLHSAYQIELLGQFPGLMNTKM